MYTVTVVHVVTSIKQSPVLKGHLFISPKGDFLIHVWLYIVCTLIFCHPLSIIVSKHCFLIDFKANQKKMLPLPSLPSMYYTLIFCQPPSIFVDAMTLPNFFFNSGLGLWCLIAISKIFQLYRGSQFYCWRIPEYPEKTTNFFLFCNKSFPI